jgi:hypothetical protein
LKVAQEFADEVIATQRCIICVPNAGNLKLHLYGCLKTEKPHFREASIE